MKIHSCPNLFQHTIFSLALLTVTNCVTLHPSYWPDRLTLDTEWKIAFKRLYDQLWAQVSDNYGLLQQTQASTAPPAPLC